MADYLGQLIQAAREVKVAKASNPRAVQTTQQRQVEVRQNPGAIDSPLTNKPRVAGDIWGYIPGGKKTAAGVAALIVGAFIVKKVL